jgi:hypothetical protein
LFGLLRCDCSGLVLRPQILRNRWKALTATDCVLIDWHGWLQCAFLLFNASGRLVGVCRRFVFVGSLFDRVCLSVLVLFLLDWRRELSGSEFGGGMVDDSHGLVLPRLNSWGVGSALDGIFISQRGGKQVGVGLPPFLLLVNFLLQCGDGILAESCSAEALGPDLEGAGTFGMGGGGECRYRAAGHVGRRVVGGGGGGGRRVVCGRHGRR